MIVFTIRKMMTDATKMAMMTMKAMTPGDKGRPSGSASVDIDVREAPVIEGCRWSQTIQKYLKICSETL